MHNARIREMSRGAAATAQAPRTSDHLFTPRTAAAATAATTDNDSTATDNATAATAELAADGSTAAHSSDSSTTAESSTATSSSSSSSSSRGGGFEALGLLPKLAAYIEAPVEDGNRGLGLKRPTLCQCAAIPAMLKVSLIQHCWHFTMCPVMRCSCTAGKCDW
jgi:hypothetical protein